MGGSLDVGLYTVQNNRYLVQQPTSQDKNTWMSLSFVAILFLLTCLVGLVIVCAKKSAKHYSALGDQLTGELAAIEETESRHARLAAILERRRQITQRSGGAQRKP